MGIFIAPSAYLVTELLHLTCADDFELSSRRAGAGVGDHANASSLDASSSCSAAPAAVFLGDEQPSSAPPSVHQPREGPEAAAGSLQGLQMLQVTPLGASQASSTLAGSTLEESSSSRSTRFADLFERSGSPRRSMQRASSTSTSSGLEEKSAPPRLRSHRHAAPRPLSRRATEDVVASDTDELSGGRARAAMRFDATGQNQLKDLDRRLPTEDDEAAFQERLERLRARLHRGSLTRAINPSAPIGGAPGTAATRPPYAPMPPLTISITGSPVPHRARPGGAWHGSHVHEDGGVPAVVARTGAPRAFERSPGGSVWLSAHTADQLQGHIVLVTSSLKSLRHFILPLRQPTLPCIPILVVVPLRSGDGTLDEASTHWLDIAAFPDVYLLDTLGDIDADAARAGIGRAMSVVVRSNGPRPTRTFVEHMSDPTAHATRADAVTILTTLCVERWVHPSAHVISEMLHGDTLSQFSGESVGLHLAGVGSEPSITRPASGAGHPRALPASSGVGAGDHARGVSPAGKALSGGSAHGGSAHGCYHVHGDQRSSPLWPDRSSNASTSTFDQFEEGLSSLQFGPETREVEGNSDRSIVRAAGLPGALPQMAACFAAGKITLSDVADKLSSQAFFNPHIMPMIAALLNPSLHNANRLHEDQPSYGRSQPEGEPPICSAHLSLIEIPTRFCDKCKLRTDRDAPVDADLPAATPPSWGNLFDWLLEVHGIIGMAMYVHTLDDAQGASADVGASVETSGNVKKASAMRKFSKAQKRRSHTPAGTESPSSAQDAAPPPESDAPPTSRSPGNLAPTEASLRPTPARKRLSLTLLSRATSADSKLPRGTADGLPAASADSGAGDLSRMYVVTNPARSQRLRGTEWIFALLPPSAMANSQDVKHVRGLQQAGATPADSSVAPSRAKPTGTPSAAAPAVAPRVPPHEDGRPMPIITPPPSPPESQCGKLDQLWRARARGPIGCTPACVSGD